MFANVKGKAIEYEGFIPVKSTIKFKFMERVRILFGDTVAFYVHVYTKEKVTIVHMDSRAGVGPEHKAGLASKGGVVKKIVPILLALLLLSCRKQDDSPAVVCKSVTIYFDSYDTAGHHVDTWVGWYNPKVCGEDLKGFTEQAPEMICTPQLYRRIVIK